MQEPRIHPGLLSFLGIDDAVASVGMDKRAIGWLLVVLQIAVFVVLALLPWRSTTVASVVLATPFLLGGGLLGFWSFQRLGNALTPTPVPIHGAGLRTTGPYSWVRHPIYSAVLLITLGFLVAAGSVWSWLWGVAIFVFFWLKSRWEDSLLAEEYGTEWQSWAKSTGALIPRRRRAAP